MVQFLIEAAEQSRRLAERIRVGLQRSVAGISEAAHLATAEERLGRRVLAR